MPISHSFTAALILVIACISSPTPARALQACSPIFTLPAPLTMTEVTQAITARDWLFGKIENYHAEVLAQQKVLLNALNKSLESHRLFNGVPAVATHTKEVVDIWFNDPYRVNPKLWINAESVLHNDPYLRWLQDNMIYVELDKMYTVLIPEGGTLAVKPPEGSPKDVIMKHLSGWQGVSLPFDFAILRVQRDLDPTLTRAERLLITSILNLQKTEIVIQELLNKLPYPTHIHEWKEVSQGSPLFILGEAVVLARFLMAESLVYGDIERPISDLVESRSFPF